MVAADPNREEPAGGNIDVFWRQADRLTNL